MSLHLVIDMNLSTEWVAELDPIWMACNPLVYDR